MNSEIIVALIAGAGTIIGSFSGIVASSRLINHRIECLERKVDKHNHLVERMIVVEQSAKSAHRRIDELKEDC